MISIILAQNVHTKGQQAFFERFKKHVVVLDVQDDLMPNQKELPKKYGLKMASSQWHALNALKQTIHPFASQCWGISTLICCGRRVITSSQDSTECSKVVQLLSGRTHRVLTTVVTELRGKLIHKQVETKVHWKRLNQTEHQRYHQSLVSLGSHAHHLAAINGQFPEFIKQIQGCPGNLTGVPAYALFSMIEH